MKNKRKCLITCVLATVFVFTGCSTQGNQGGTDVPPNGNSTEITEIVTEYQPTLYGDGIYTVTQSSGSYQETLALPSDSMLVFGEGYDRVESQIKGWVNSGGYKQIDLFLPIGRDHNSYFVDGKYDGKTHEEIIQTRQDGTRLTHPTGKTYYTFPSAEYSLFMADYAKKAIAAGATDVYIEEPDGFTDGVYCPFIYDKWQEVYGEAFTDPQSSVNARYKGDKLVAQVFTEAMDIIAKDIKSTYPDTKIFICTHSSLSYASNPISANNFDIVNLDSVDGIIGQAWTNTSTQAINYGGESVSMPFEVGYAEYAELKSIKTATGKKFYSLSDPAADGDFNFDYIRGVYEQNVVSQLLQPDINNFQISIWPDRSFGNASPDYKRAQQAVFAALNEVSTKNTVLRSGSTGVALLMSYNAVSNGNPHDIRSYVLSVVEPLLRQGIPCDVLLLEGLSAEVLSKYSTLVLSYNYIKPENEGVNDLLKSFVEGGGSLVYLGGEDNNSQLNGFWGEGSSPRANLLNKLAISHKENYFTKKLNVKKTTSTPVWFDEFSTDFEVGGASVQTQSGTEYLTVDGEAILVGEGYGTGNLLRLGVDTGSILRNADMRELLVDTVHLAIVLSGKKYVAPEYLISERGDYITVKTYGREVELKGTYINIFDDEMKIISNPVVKEESYGIYKKLPQDGNVRVFYANCTNLNEREADNVFTFESKTVFTSGTHVIVSLPYVNYGDISVVDSLTGEVIAFEANFDETNRMLYLRYEQSVRNPIKVKITLR